MKKLIFITVLASVALSSYLNAAAHFTGQKEYLKKCRECHRGSDIFVQKFTMNKWTELLKNDGEMLAEIHANIKDENKKETKAKEARAYFKSKRYKKRLADMRMFTKRYAKDGDHPTLINIK